MPRKLIDGEENVGVYLSNDNAEDFNVDFKLKVGRIERKFENQKIEANDDWGPHGFLTHEQCVS